MPDRCPAARVLNGGGLDWCAQPNDHTGPHITAAGTVFPAKVTHSCPTCGAEREGPEQVDVSALSSVFSTTLTGRYRTPCPTPRCGEVCKICRREPGDVHGPDCGPLMFPKLERPHIVTPEDCR